MSLKVVRMDRECQYQVTFEHYSSHATFYCYVVLGGLLVFLHSINGATISDIGLESLLELFMNLNKGRNSGEYFGKPSTIDLYSIRLTRVSSSPS